jgi:hypothetical protein
MTEPLGAPDPNGFKPGNGAAAVDTGISLIGKAASGALSFAQRRQEIRQDAENTTARRHNDLKDFAWRAEVQNRFDKDFASHTNELAKDRFTHESTENRFTHAHNTAVDIYAHRERNKSDMSRIRGVAKVNNAQQETAIGRGITNASYDNFNGGNSFTHPGTPATPPVGGAAKKPAAAAGGAARTRGPRTRYSEYTPNETLPQGGTRTYYDIGDRADAAKVAANKAHHDNVAKAARVAEAKRRASGRGASPAAPAQAAPATNKGSRAVQKPTSTTAQAPAAKAPAKKAAAGQKPGLTPAQSAVSRRK